MKISDNLFPVDVAGFLAQVAPAPEPVSRRSGGAESGIVAATVIAVWNSAAVAP